MNVILIVIVFSALGALGLVFIPALFPLLGNFFGYLIILIHVIVMSLAIICYKKMNEKKTFMDLFKISFVVFILTTLIYDTCLFFMMGIGIMRDAVTYVLPVVLVTLLMGAILGAILSFIFKQREPGWDVHKDGES